MNRHARCKDQSLRRQSAKLNGNFHSSASQRELAERGLLRRVARGSQPWNPSWYKRQWYWLPSLKPPGLPVALFDYPRWWKIRSSRRRWRSHLPGAGPQWLVRLLVGCGGLCWSYLWKSLLLVQRTWFGMLTMGAINHHDLLLALLLQCLSGGFDALPVKIGCLAAST